MANDNTNKSTASSKLGSLEPLSKEPTKSFEVSEIELGVGQAEPSPACKTGESEKRAIDESADVELEPDESEGAAEAKNNPEASPRKNEPGLFLVRPKSAERGIVKQWSARKCEASRQNGKRFSTGPKTERGKSNSRRNSLKHGLLARAIPLRNLPFYNPKDELEVKKLMRDLCRDWKPLGRTEEILVEEIAWNYVQLSRLCRFQTADATIAMNKEFHVPIVEEKNMETPFLEAERSREKLSQILSLAEDVPRTDAPISWGLMAMIYKSTFNREKWNALQRLFKIINARAANLGASASKRDQELREKFLETLASAVFEALDAIDANLERPHQLAIARFEQHLLPDEGTFRKIVRYHPMLNRELRRCIAQLEHLQARRRANEYCDSEPVDDSLPGDGKIAA